MRSRYTSIYSDIMWHPTVVLIDFKSVNEKGLHDLWDRQLAPLECVQLAAEAPKCLMASWELKHVFIYIYIWYICMAKSGNFTMSKSKSKSTNHFESCFSLLEQLPKFGRLNLASCILTLDLVMQRKEHRQASKIFLLPLCLLAKLRTPSLSVWLLEPPRGPNYQTATHNSNLKPREYRFSIVTVTHNERGGVNLCRSQGRLEMSWLPRCSNHRGWIVAFQSSAEYQTPCSAQAAQSPVARRKSITTDVTTSASSTIPHGFMASSLSSSFLGVKPSPSKESMTSASCSSCSNLLRCYRKPIET